MKENEEFDEVLQYFIIEGFSKILHKKFIFTLKYQNTVIQFL